MKFKWFFCGLLALALATASFAQTSTNEYCSALSNAVILVIRHAEKPETGSGLSAEGEARAQVYVQYFKDFKINGQPATPDSLFAAADSKESHRSRLTLEPTGKALGLVIDSRFKNKKSQELVNEIKARPHGKVLLIAWHHGEIPELLQALGATPKAVLPKGKWPDAVFDWLIQLRFDTDGRLLETKRIKEDLLPSSARLPAPANP
jgi:hypothetical protein